MQPPISEATKRAVIEEYLRGKSRDQIAIDLGIGTGTVSKIFSEFKAGLPNADELRELVLVLRKLGISASRYAQGARIASCLINLGVNDEEFHQFVSVIYDRCKKMDLSPDKVAYLLKQLLDLSQSVPVGQIPEYIEEQRSQVQKSKEELEKLDAEILDRKTDLCIALDEEATTLGELDQFSSLKAVMDKNGLAMFDNSKFVDAVVGAKQLGFDPRVIVEKLSNLAKMEADKKEVEEKVQFLQKRRNDLESKCSDLEAEEFVHAHTISIYEKLEAMGMGIKKLKLLHHTVEEIATANNISKDSASQKFFSDVEQQYDDKLGFEAKLQNLKSEIEKNELIKLQLTILTAWFNSIILSQLEQIQQVSSFVEFGPLVKAAKGQKVPINQLKSAVIKALDILISSDPILSIGMVKTTRQFLENDIRKSGNIAP
jgi:hypothetical protein